MKATTAQEKENGHQEENSAQTKEGETGQTFPLNGGEEHTTPAFLMDGQPNYQLLGQVLQALLLQAGQKQ